MTVNAQLQDRAIDHAVDVLRFNRGVVMRMIATLNRADARLAAALAEAILRLDRDSFTVERLEALLGSVRAINAQAYQEVFAALAPEIRGLATAEAAAQVSMMRVSVPAAIQVAFPIAAVAPEQVYAAALSRPFQGRLLSGWAANVEASRMTLIRNAIRTGIVDGLTTDQIIRSIRGTRARKYEDGILARPRRDLASVVQTALSHTQQTARQVFYDANTDLIKAVQWVSTLDTRTSTQCRVRDGLRYEPDAKHKPIGHSVPWLEGPGRIHFNCRSVSVPITKSWRELGIDADELPTGTRASMDGQVPEDTTYAQWIARQSYARQVDILGEERAKLLRDGKVTFDKFSDDKGRWLTLDELMERIGWQV